MVIRRIAKSAIVVPNKVAFTCRVTELKDAGQTQSENRTVEGENYAH